MRPLRLAVAVAAITANLLVTSQSYARHQDGGPMLTAQQAHRLIERLNPPPPKPDPPPAPVGCLGITPYPGANGTCYAIPADIVYCESGGSETAQNPSGAYGLYQLLGHGEYPGMPKAEQDAIAAQVWAGGAGRGNWVC